MILNNLDSGSCRSIVQIHCLDFIKKKLFKKSLDVRIVITVNLINDFEQS